jgi:ATP-dependent RNA helicase HelY
MESRSHVIARTFDRVCGVLDELGYLDGETVTPQGRRLAQLYTELDLLTAECLRAGIWDELDPAELAACVSALVYESRQADDARQPKIPAGRAKDSLAAMVRTFADLENIEHGHALSFVREPDLGFAWSTYRWARGHNLDAVLTENDLAAGDFVRWTKQLLDLLDQIAKASPQGSKVRHNATKAIDALRRGVVAYSSVG